MDAWLSESLDTSSLSSDISICCCRSVRGGADPGFKPTDSLGMGTSPMSLSLLSTFQSLRAPILIVGSTSWGILCVNFELLNPVCHLVNLLVIWLKLAL